MLEMDCGRDERVVGYLGTADLSCGGTAENMRCGVELADRLQQPGILQNSCGAEHEDKLCGLRQRCGGTGRPSAGLRPCSLLGFHGCSARARGVLATITERFRTVHRP